MEETTEKIKSQEVDLFKSVFYGMQLPKADLPNRSFESSDLTRANFRGVDLSNANFQDADLYDTNLRDANLDGAK